MTAAVPIKAVAESTPIKAATSGAHQRPLLRLYDVAKTFSTGTTLENGLFLPGRGA